jgi:DNA-binding NarL/FixJ family response regulator
VVLDRVMHSISVGKVESDQRRPYVLCLDRHLLFAEALASALISFGIAASAQSVPAFGNSTSTYDIEPADVVLVDASDSWPSVAAWLRRSRLSHAGPRMLLLVDGTPPASARAVAAAGASGWLDRGADLANMVEAVMCVAGGGTWFPTLPPGPGINQNHHSARLTAREAEILAHLARGESDAVIAGAMCLSPHTVRTHVQNLRAKLGVTSRFAAVTAARRARLLEPVHLAGSA